MDECYEDLIEIVEIIPDAGWQQLLIDFLNQVCDEETCSVHGTGGLSLQILRQMDLPEREFVAAIRKLLKPS